MKFSKSLIIRVVLFAIVCVIIVGILPTRAQVYLEGKDTEKGIETFNYYAEISDSVFYGDFGDTIPKSIEGFDFVKLEDLGTGINTDFNETIELIKKPFGSAWITHAFELTIISLVKQLAEGLVNAKISNILYSTILSCIGIIIVFILFILLFPGKFMKIEKEILLNEPIKPKWFVMILSGLNIILLASLLGIITYMIVVSIPMSIKLIKFPPIANFGQINYGATFYITTLVFLFGIVFSIFLLIYFFRTKQTALRKFYSFILIIPIIALGYNLWSSTRFVESVNVIIDSQNMNSNRQMMIHDCRKVAYCARQWFLTNSEMKEQNLAEFIRSESFVLPENEYGQYSFSVEGNLLTIIGNAKHDDEDRVSALGIVTYNTETDSIKVKMEW
ncbi:MAG: hypothetical protein PF570_05415 [Candidatus Cloacimonetes bacterium]|jgi:hypothetical protein|nr:hypothetical protein [Candidatus Cloacimonadota bacterium]